MAHHRGRGPQGPSGATGASPGPQGPSGATRAGPGPQGPPEPADAKIKYTTYVCFMHQRDRDASPLKYVIIYVMLRHTWSQHLHLSEKTSRS